MIVNKLEIYNRLTRSIVSAPNTMLHMLANFQNLEWYDNVETTLDELSVTLSVGAVMFFVILFKKRRKLPKSKKKND